MLGAFKKRWKIARRPALENGGEDDEKDEEPQDVAPARFIKISDGKISLGPPLQYENVVKDKEELEARIHDLEEAHHRLEQQINSATNSQCGSPTLDKDLKEQLESMNRAMKSKEKKAMQVCRDHKVLQMRFARQEALLDIMHRENQTLQERVRQYEHCLDDVMRKVVTALVAEDSLREEVTILKNRVRDLEAQNAAFSVSPAKGKDEGYCTMSSGQPQPSNGHLENLPEEPEQWVLPVESCSTEMEDWSMSQEELGVITIDDDINEHEHDWIWNSNDFLNSTMMETQSDGITRLLQDTIIYSEDEDIACTEFTKDFYKLVNILPSEGAKSLHSDIEPDTDDEDEETQSDLSGLCHRGPSPTASEAGLAQVTSCSSSESDENAVRATTDDDLSSICYTIKEATSDIQDSLRPEVVESSPSKSPSNGPKSPWKKSNGWRRIPTLSPKKGTKIATISPLVAASKPPPANSSKFQSQASPARKSRIPPPVPVRRSYAS